MNAALEIRAVCKAYDAETVLDELDLSVQPGEVHALVGLNGAGKTTLMRVALGMTRPESGTVEVLGFDVATAPSTCWAGVGHMIETPFAYPELSVTENLYAAARLHGIDRSHADHAVLEIVSRLGLDPFARRRAAALSLGNKQRVGLASALVHHPRLLILDEPTNALDPSGVVLLRDLVREVANSGAGVLVSSHHLDEVARVADRISAIHRGRIVGELDPSGSELERAFFELVHRADQAMSAGKRSVA